ncbi:MAG: SDR family oxidoreductase [Actinomycetota bacterium]
MPAVLAGRRVVVTGASSGIGAAIARSIVSTGGRVAMIARRAERLDGLAEELGAHAVALPCDVTNYEELNDVVAKAAAAFGGLDAVVANAGHALVGHIATGDPASWRKLLDVDLFGVLATIRATLPHFADEGPRDVLLVGSTAAVSPHEISGVYSAAKRGVAAIADSLRLELAPRSIRVCLLEPGDIATELRDRAVREEGRPATRPVTGTHTPMAPEELAEIVTFILFRPERIALNHVVVRPTGELTP